MKLLKYVFYRYYTLNQNMIDQSSNNFVDHAVGFLLVTLSFYFFGIFVLFFKFMNKILIWSTEIQLAILFTTLMLYLLLSYFFKRQGFYKKVLQEFSENRSILLEVFFWVYNLGSFIILFSCSYWF